MIGRMRTGRARQRGESGPFRIPWCGPDEAPACRGASAGRGADTGREACLGRRKRLGRGARGQRSSRARVGVEERWPADPAVPSAIAQRGATGRSVRACPTRFATTYKICYVNSDPLSNVEIPDFSTPWIPRNRLPDRFLVAQTCSSVEPGASVSIERSYPHLATGWRAGRRKITVASQASAAR